MADKHHPSSRLFYFVAVALGLSFSVVLVVLAWNNVIHNETRNFAIDAIAAQNSVESSIRTTDAIVDNLAGFFSANTNPDELAFASYTQGILERYGFVSSLARVHYSVADGITVRELAGQLTADYLGTILQEPDSLRVIDEGLVRKSAPIPIVSNVPQQESSRLMLVERVGSHDGVVTLAVLTIDLARLVNAIAVDPTVNLALYTESEGIGGRRLVYLRSARPNTGSPVVEALAEDSIVRLGGFSVRLVSTKNVFWNDLDNGLIFVALLLGVGVMLLLVALARAKDIQARELQARNRVIEEQVERQTKALAEARDSALEASRVKSDFLASMSHEIRTPLNAIIGMADLLSESKLDDEQEKYVGVFRNSGEALLGLVNDILDLSKIEAEQLTLEAIEFKLSDIVEQAAEIYALKADSGNVDLITVIDPALPGTVVGDPGRIRQIILNLIGNAIKFTERGQIVVRVGPGDGNGRVQFEVCDSGIGIPSDKLDTIFANFTQVDSSITRKYGGTGLGLAICKRLVEMMDGRIWVDSVEQQGSCFRFEISLAGAALQPAPLPGPEPVQRVVIGSPNGVQAEVLQGMLCLPEANVECVVAPLGLPAELEHVLRSGPVIDFCIIDASADVQAVVGLIKGLRLEGDMVPVVTLFRPSGLAQGVEGLRGVAAASYVTKPVRGEQLIAAIHQARSGPVRRPASVVSTEVPVTAGARILLVEDNPDNRLLVKSYLKNEPYELTEAENGAEAVAMFMSGDFELVLMDVQMPVMDGYAATRAIRDWERENKRERTPIIALTANAVSDDIDNSRAAGCDDHLTKPIKKKTLIGAVRDYLVELVPG